MTSVDDNAQRWDMSARMCVQLLELRTEKSQSQKELNWNEKHFPGLCFPELIRLRIGSLRSLLRWGAGGGR